MAHEPHSARSGNYTAERSQCPNREDRMTGGDGYCGRVDRLSDSQSQLDCYLVADLNISGPSTFQGDRPRLMRRCSAGYQAFIGKRAIL